MLIKKNKIDRIRGFGKFKSKNQLEIFNEDVKKTDNIKASKIIVATGASSKFQKR